MNSKTYNIFGLLIIVFFAITAITGIYMSISNASLEVSIRALDNDTVTNILLNYSTPISQKTHYINNLCDSASISEYGDIGVERCKQYFVEKYLLP